MTCDQVRDTLALVAVGEGEPVSPEVVHHLAMCEACVLAYRRYLSTTGRLLDAVASIAPPDRLRASIMERAASERPDREGQRLTGEQQSFDDPTSETEAPASPPFRWSMRGPLGGWAAAALLLAALNIGLVWDGWSAKQAFVRLQQGTHELRAELDETWSAFSGAPAVYAGSLDFQMGQGFRSGGTSAQGYLYARPNGWAVLFRIDGLTSSENDTYDVWLDSGSGWERRGAVQVGMDGVATWIHYAREPEVTLRRVHIAAAGAMPGTPEWVSDAVASARVLSEAGTIHLEGGAW